MNIQSRLARSCADRLGHRWGVILAGGDGKRLLPFTRMIFGDDQPKQFCAIMGRETLLTQTQHRIERLIAPPRILMVVTKKHERFYADQSVDAAPCSLLVQPCNRGTAPAILFGLFHLRESDPAAIVGFFPSDHYFADDAAFIAQVDLAYKAAESSSGRVVLLGIAATRPEVEYGWIEPGAPFRKDGFGTVFQVRRFWEKPKLSLASALMERGCLWNSFVMIGHVDAFLNLAHHTLPGLRESFKSNRSSFSTRMEPAALLQIYWDIGVSDFSRNVLAARSNDLSVLSGGNLGWSDLGETSRVLAALGRNATVAQSLALCR